MDGSGLMRWEWGNPEDVAISRETARRRKKKTGPVPSCDGCMHLDRVFDRPVCAMGKKKIGRGCLMFVKGEGIK
jgi:hypothetical protein